MRKIQILGLMGASILTGTTVFLLNRNITAKYSDKWLRTVSKDELKEEREKIRIMWCSIKGDFSLAVKVEALLRLLDNELRKRDWGDLSPENYRYPPHREHGWNLYKPD